MQFTGAQPSSPKQPYANSSQIRTSCSKESQGGGSAFFSAQMGKKSQAIQVDPQGTLDEADLLRNLNVPFYAPSISSF